ncbi:uncharacterized protein EDB93DRAFT_1252783 [Suillus bovinus]|uniref:uncharacterized protein n=1 Tax=Suillus bovinus TaxID=48563 RepID=UPI001B86DEB0|nr:uncharacterized protein EDB93DRAFT_1252783 [Suillus bovinus]KAG2140496.1 hypothetical protein EDB93DRAFT_1252783 [Suillus bovinus]
MQQLRSYCYRAASSAGRARHTQFTKTITKLMATSTAWPHGPTAMEHFLQTHYKEDSSVKEEVAAQSNNCEYMQKNCMSGLCAEASKAMTAHGKAYMMRMEEEAKAKCQYCADKVKHELEELRNPSDTLKLQYIEGLGRVAGQLLEIIFETTGWHGSIYLGGLYPCANGDIHVFRKGSTGFTFRNSLPDHTRWIVKPFTMFLKGAFASSATSQPPEGLHGEEQIDFFSGVDMLNPTPSFTEACANTPSIPVQELSALESLPMEGRGVFIHPADKELCDVIHPYSHDPNSYSLPNGSFDSGFYRPLNHYMIEISLPEPEPDMDYNLPILPPFPSQDGPDTPITAWNKDFNAGRISVFYLPHLHDAFACVASLSPSVQGKKIPHACPVIWGQATAPSIYDQLCDSAPPSPNAPPAGPLLTVPDVAAVPGPLTSDTSTSSNAPALPSTPPAPTLMSPNAPVLPSTPPALTPMSPNAPALMLAVPPSSTPISTLLSCHAPPAALVLAVLPPALPALTSTSIHTPPAALVSAVPPPAPPTALVSAVTAVPAVSVPLMTPMEGSQPQSSTVDQPMEEMQPFDEIVNQSFYCSSQNCLPSTRLMDANKIGNTSKR